MKTLIRKTIIAVIGLAIAAAILYFAGKALLTDVRVPWDAIFNTAVVAGCLYAIYRNGRTALLCATALKNGPRTAYATVDEYRETEHHASSDDDDDDDDGTVVSVSTQYRFRLDDGSTVVFDTLPTEAMNDPVLRQAARRHGTHVIMTWYERPQTWQSLELDPLTASQDTMPQRLGAMQRRTADAETLVARQKSRFRPLTYATVVAVAVIIIGSLALYGSLSPFGIQGVIKDSMMGLAPLGIAAWILVHMAVKGRLLRQVGASEDIDEPSMRKILSHNRGFHLYGFSIPLLAGIIMAFSGLTGLAVGPRTVPAQYESVEMRTEYDDHGSNDYADFSFTTEDGHTLTVTCDWSDKDAAERIIGEPGRPILLTYWPGGGIDVLDHVEPDPARQ